MNETIAVITCMGILLSSTIGQYHKSFPLHDHRATARLYNIQMFCVNQNAEPGFWSRLRDQLVCFKKLCYYSLAALAFFFLLRTMARITPTAMTTPPAARPMIRPQGVTSM